MKRNAVVYSVPEGQNRETRPRRELTGTVAPWNATRASGLSTSHVSMRHLARASFCLVSGVVPTLDLQPLSTEGEGKRERERERERKERERGFYCQPLRTRALVVGESMGEEEKKKPEEGKKEAVAAAAAEGEKKATPEEGKKEEEKEKKEEGKEKKDGEGEKKEGEGAPPPPPPVEVVMKVYMHCEGCARKVRKSLSGFEGVEAVTADYRIHRVVVKGQKAAEDPMKVVERVQRKSHRRVELISPIPPPKPEKEEEKEEEKPKVEEKKEEPRVIVVQLKVHMHCEACAKETKKRILRMKGVQAAETDLKSSTVTVTGVFDPARLEAYVHKRTRRHAVVLKQEPAEKKPEAAPEKAESAAEVEAKDEKEADAGEKKDKKEEDGDGEKKEDEKKAAEGCGEEVRKEAGGGDGEEKETEKKKDSSAVTDAAVVAVVATAAADGGVGKMRRNEFYYYYPRYPVEYAYPPQIFSDENPNACTVM